MKQGKLTHPPWRVQLTCFTLIVLLAALLIAVIRACSGPSGPYTPGQRDAWQMTKVLVAQQLKAPATAEWPSAPIGSERTSNAYVLEQDQAGEFEVRAWVDSQNSFGAQVRTDFRAVVRYVGNNEWHLVQFEPVTR